MCKPNTKIAILVTPLLFFALLVVWVPTAEAATGSVIYEHNRSVCIVANGNSIYDQGNCPDPAGGCEHARAISRASTSPVTGDGTGGRSRFLREIVARTSPPVSVNRLATSRSISPETPSRAAITSFGSGSPTEVSSASSTRARLIVDAGCTPVVVSRINSSRSRADNVTGRFISEAMA